MTITLTYNREKLYRSTLCFYLYNNRNNQPTLATLKNRYGKTSETINLDDSIPILAEVLVRLKFGHNMDLFREHTREKLIEKMREVLIERS